MKFIIAPMLALAAIAPAWTADVIHVVDSDYPPFTYLKDNTPTGFSIEVLQEMAKRANVDLKR